MMQIKHPLLLFVGLALGPFMAGIDLLAIGVAIEPMTKALSISIATLQWFLTAYSIGNSSFLVTAGRLADFYGKKIIFLLGLALFSLASGAIALSSSPLLIIILRLIQGASGGMLVLVAIASIVAIHPPENRSGWMAGIVGAAGMGMVVGPLVGGFLIHHFSWRMIFLINVPIGVFAILLTYFTMPQLPKSAKKGERIDWTGVILLTALLVVFSTAISQGHFWGWSSWKTIALFGLTLLILLLFILVEKRVKDPLVEVQLFKMKNFLVGGLAGTTLYFAFMAWVLIFGIYLQRVEGMTPLQAGISFLPFGLLLAVVSVTMQKLTRIFGAKKLIVWGLIFCFLAFIGLAMIPIIPPYWLLALLFALFGLGFVLVNSTCIPIALEFIPLEKAGVASGKSMMLRWLGGALGSAIMATVFMSHSYSKLLKQTSTGPLSGEQSYLHDVLVGTTTLPDFREHFQGEVSNLATQVLDKSYHHGLSVSMLIVAVLFLITTIGCMLFVKEKKTR
jgi:EmrB/QacA subfamily drug resistance transporter